MAAVLGSKVGRTADWWAGWRHARAAVRVEGKTFHVCPDGYRSLLAPAEVCFGCGWSPTLPVPSLDDVAEVLVDRFTAELAEAWVEELLDLVRLHGGLA